jgi:hypothetical protein
VAVSDPVEVVLGVGVAERVEVSDCVAVSDPVEVVEGV